MRNDYVDENSLKFELTAVNIKDEYNRAANETLKNELLEKFNKRKNDRIQEVKNLLATSKLKPKEKEFYEAELMRLNDLTIQKQNKEIMGNMVLLITRNLAKKPCFSGYTLNWKDEFFSKAIEHCFKYNYNFDENKISQRSGKKVKAFAYITQIIYTAFLDVISKRKKEQERLKISTTIADLAKEDAPFYFEKVSTYRKRLTLRFDVLDDAKLNECYTDLKRFKELFDLYHALKSEVLVLEKFKKEQDFIKEERELFDEYHKVLLELDNLKKKYKISLYPEEIEIICNEYGEFQTKISEYLRMFEEDGACCVITLEKNKEKEANAEKVEDF